MNKSESIKELAAALAKAQPLIKGAVKDSVNPFFKSKYADLSSVVEAIREPLAKNGLSYVQLNQPSETNQVCVETVLIHTSGEWISGVISLPVTKADAQGHGSAITYARRYGLSAIVGLTAEDDDGNVASGKNGKTELAKPQQKKEAPTVAEGTAAKGQKALIRVLCSQVLDESERKEWLFAQVGKSSTTELDKQEITPLVDRLVSMGAKVKESE